MKNPYEERITCKQCQKAITLTGVAASQHRLKPRQYCSQACYYAHKQTENTKEITCVECGEKVMVSSARASQNKYRGVDICSSDCGKARSARKFRKGGKKQGSHFIGSLRAMTYVDPLNPFDEFETNTY